MDSGYKMIPIKDLKPTQRLLSDLLIERINVWMKNGGDFFITVFYKDGLYHIYNGHHRAYCWWKLNHETIKVKVIEETKEVTAAVEFYSKPAAETLADLEIVPHHKYKQK